MGKDYKKNSLYCMTRKSMVVKLGFRGFQCFVRWQTTHGSVCRSGRCGQGNGLYKPSFNLHLVDSWHFIGNYFQVQPIIL